MQEDADAWRAVGRSPDRHEWLGFPDGEVDQIPLDQLTEAVGQILDEEQPTVVATFGPDGIFGHPDHIAIGTATDAAFLRSRSQRVGRVFAGCCTALSRRPSSDAGTTSDESWD